MPTKPIRRDPRDPVRGPNPVRGPRDGGGGGGGQGGGGGNGGGGGGGGGNGGGRGGRGGRGGGGIGGLNIQELFNLGMNLSHPNRQARRDINLMYRPQIRGLKQDYNRYSNQMGALYDILGNKLKEAGDPAAANIGQIQGDYSQGVEGIIGALGNQIQTPEQMAFLNTLGTQATAGAEGLATQGANEQRLNASFQRQGALESNALQRQAAFDLREGLSSLRDQRRLDMRSRLDELRATAFERMLALKEYQLRAAAAADARNSNDFLADFAGGLAGLGLGGSGGGGPNNGGGGGGGQQGGGGGGGGGPDPRNSSSAPNRPPGWYI